MATKNQGDGDKGIASQRAQGDSDALRLQNTDHPGMGLVSVPLDGTNYLSWSRAVRVALGAKQKLSFIHGNSQKPATGSEELEQWQRTDYMVISWLLNSVSKEIGEAFIYAPSARDLWVDLKDRFGESNGPFLYQIQREISSVSQGDQTISIYFTRLKKLWDELACLNPLPTCSCGSSKALADMTSSSQLIQFLMGLNDAYDHVRNQILLMEPLPSIGKAYSMTLRVEKQREVHSNFPSSWPEGSAPVSWKTKKQNTVSRSTAEAKYRSMASAACELTWLTYLLTDFGILVQLPVPFYCDNKAALHITENPVFHERTKHLEIDCHIVRDKFKDGLIQPTFVSSKLQLADLFTKPLAASSFLNLRSKLNLISAHPSLTCGGDVKLVKTP
ncbi:UNVERIFIED_CONTAM: Retrovirus-related Pol polyprotein from transposon RE2 [Sesamum radiatum]|uniref:Retrovirus-related Pol polyprotein from transposon RE2 n=1 Tax=Sesamum radiatum TaxID=300843 RepID=A0AAW2R2U6_SESRA